MSLYCHISPSVAPLFSKGELDAEALFSSPELGEILSQESHGRELRRFSISADGKKHTFFLKRLGKEPFLKTARMLCYGKKPQSGPLRELRLLRCLREAGFLSMEPVAWGEKRFFGVPTGGFLVVREVVGQDVAALFDGFTGAERSCLSREIGCLVGRLHAAGFYHPVRLKDLILAEASQGEPERLTLIDRETSKPWPAHFSRTACLRSLARAARRTLRDGHRFGPGSAGSFLRGYADGVASGWSVPARQLAHQFLAALRQELSGK